MSKKPLQPLTFILLAGFLGTGQAASQANTEARLSRARLLYSCFSFTRAMSQSVTDKTQQEALRRGANNFLLLATSEVVAVDEDKNPLNTELAQKYGKLGDDDFKVLLDKAGSLSSEKERNETLGNFANSCTVAMSESASALTTQAKSPATNNPMRAAEAAFAKGDYLQTLKLLTPLAEAGDDHAQTTLGTLYSSGLGVSKNLEKGIYWTKKAAEAGNVIAQANLGLAYVHGAGVEQNDKQATYWLEKAADKGNAGAQNTLGVMYVDGRGVTQNYAKAKTLFLSAIKQGDVGVRNNLARMLESGQGGTPDLQAALDMYRIAAERGDAAAQNRIGLAYRDGELRPKDLQKAKEWFYKAAQQGEMFAQYHYGLMLMEENPKDLVSNLKWIKLSARRNHEPALQELAKHASSLTPEQSAELDKSVSLWYPTGNGQLDPGVR